MARPATNHQTRKAEIVAAALKSFAVYGYEGTSNKTIAQEGGFKSPALIYHYFPGGKAELFQTCLEEFQPLKTFQKMMETELELPIEQYLRKLGLNYLKTVNDDRVRAVMRIVVTEAPRFPELAGILPTKLAPLILQPTLIYFSRYAMTHEMQVTHPMALILEFFGPLLARTLLRLVGIDEGKSPLPFPTDEELVDSLVATFLHGILKPSGNEATLKE
jgi:TetR/AcrR family transcriptional repressor of mexJK operon